MDRAEEIAIAAFHAAISHIRCKEEWDEIEAEAQDEYTRIGLAAVRAAYEIDGVGELVEAAEVMSEKLGTMTRKPSQMAAHRKLFSAPARDYVEGLLHPEIVADYGKSLHYFTDHNDLVVSVKDGDGNNVPMDDRVIGIMAPCGLKPCTPENEQEAKENKRKEDEIAAFAARCGEACAKELDSVFLSVVNEAPAPSPACRMWKRWAYTTANGSLGSMTCSENSTIYDQPITILPGHDAVEQIELAAYERGKRDGIAEVRPYIEEEKSRLQTLYEVPDAIDGVEPVVVDGFTFDNGPPWTHMLNYHGRIVSVFENPLGDCKTPCRVHLYPGVGSDGKRVSS